MCMGRFNMLIWYNRDSIVQLDYRVVLVVLMKHANACTLSSVGLIFNTQS